MTRDAQRRRVRGVGGCTARERRTRQYLVTTRLSLCARRSGVRLPPRLARARHQPMGGHAGVAALHAEPVARADPHAWWSARGSSTGCGVAGTPGTRGWTTRPGLWRRARRARCRQEPWCLATTSRTGSACGDGLSVTGELRAVDPRRPPGTSQHQPPEGDADEGIHRGHREVVGAAGRDELDDWVHHREHQRQRVPTGRQLL